MKTIVISTILVIIGGAIFLLSFKFKEPGTTEVSVFRDLTEKHLSQPSDKEIIDVYQLHENRWKGGIFRFSNVTDVSFNQWQEVNIDPVNQWLSNELERRQQVKKFEDTISFIISSSDKDSIGKEYSSVYFPIVAELNRLSQSKSETKKLLVYSDLMENELDVSLYAKGVFDLLRSNPDSLESIFEKKQPLSDLKGIEVYFIYQPADVKKDKEFRIVSAFYKELFEEKEATVFIKANLN